MKYINRKQTPLKWHRFLRFILLPAGIVMTGLVLICLISELYGLNLFPKFSYLTRSLSYLNVSMNNLGNYFWPVVLILSYFLGLFLMMIYTFAGFFHWHNYSRIIRTIYLIINTCLISFVIFMCFDKESSIYTVLSGFLRNTTMKTSTAYILFMIIGIVLCLFSLFYTISNIIYYRKRKPLFAEYYIQPAEKSVSSTAEDADKVSDLQSHEMIEMREQSENRKDNDTEVQYKEEKEPALSDSHESADEIVEVQAEFKQLYCPECGHKLTLADGKFCTECGKKLY